MIQKNFQGVRKCRREEVTNRIFRGWKPRDISIVVIMAKRIHLFPSRTQKLSSLAPKVLSGWPLGRIGHRHILFLVSSAVEHPAVNRRVVGSNPTRGAKNRLFHWFERGFFLAKFKDLSAILRIDKIFQNLGIVLKKYRVDPLFWGHLGAN